MRHLRDALNEARLCDFSGEVKTTHIHTVWVYASEYEMFSSVVFISSVPTFVVENGIESQHLEWVDDGDFIKNLVKSIEVFGDRFFALAMKEDPSCYDTDITGIRDTIRDNREKPAPDIADQVAEALDNVYGDEYEIIALHDRKEALEICNKYLKL